MLFFPTAIKYTGFLWYYFRKNTEEKVEIAEQQVSKFYEEPHPQASTTELEKSEELKAACKTLLAFLCACVF